jgi:hypothetical protein
MSQQPITLKQLLVYVERAVRGDRQLLVGLFQQLERLAHLPSAPREERLLGEILGRVLMGEREPDLTALSPEAAREIQAMLDRLQDKSQSRNGEASSKPGRLV